MVDEFRDYLVDKLVDLVDWFVSLDQDVIFFGDLTGEAAQVLVTPADQLVASALEAELESFSIVFFLRSHHCDNTRQICASCLQFCVGLGLYGSLDCCIDWTQELKRLRDRCHCTSGT